MNSFRTVSFSQSPLPALGCSHSLSANARQRRAPISEVAASKLKEAANCEAASIERHADPFFSAPDNTAWPFQLLGRHKQREAVGDEQRRNNFERRPSL
jgi:hypothetical protein